MFTKFNQKNKTIFLDPDSPEIIVNEKVNLILSPSLYWVKKLSLPLKSARDAKKLLPSIFEESIPEGNYSYSVYKKDDDFFAFAYDDKVILDTLAKKSIAVSNIDSVYFAQSELSFIEGALKVNETQSLYVKDDMLILLPCCWVEESGDLDLNELTLSKHSITLAQFGHIVDKSSLFKTAGILLAFILLVATELFITSSKVNDLVSLKEELFSKAKLQATMFQNEATLKKYERIDTKQKVLREQISAILSLRLKSAESLKKLSLKDKTFVADFNELSQESIDKIMKRLKSSGIKFKVDNKKETWHLEMRL